MKHDVIVIGGGVGGASVAHALATAGVRVLVLEREERFRDRVRGDMVDPWGVAEARRLGLADGVLDRVSVRIVTWRTTVAPLPGRDRDLPSTTPSGEAVLAFYHPEAQEALLLAAAAAGAEVLRGAVVEGIENAAGPGLPATVTFRRRGRSRAETVTEHATARLVVGADGRDSAVRGWAGFELQRDAPRLVLAGTVLHGLSAPVEEANVFFAPSAGLLAIVIPIGAGRHRVYGGYELNGGRLRLSGPSSLPRFLDLVARAGAPVEWFEPAERAGPLTAFDGADRWVDAPYQGGVVLVGDAAASSDPSFGCGMALTLRDARVLTEALLAEDDWARACVRYAAEHDRYYGALHRITDWLTRVYRDTGPAADALRRRAFPLFAADPSRVPDVVGWGPDGPSDETARRRFFGEE